MLKQFLHLARIFDHFQIFIILNNNLIMWAGQVMFFPFGEGNQDLNKKKCPS